MEDTDVIAVSDVGGGFVPSEIFSTLERTIGRMGEHVPHTPLMLLQAMWEEMGIKPDEVNFFNCMVSYIVPEVVMWEEFRNQVRRLLQHMRRDVPVAYTVVPAAVVANGLGLVSAASVFVLFKFATTPEDTEESFLEEMARLRTWIQGNLHELDDWHVRTHPITRE